MIDDMSKVLAAEGFVEADARHPEGTIHVERYW
jgi:hypothetical protein